MQPGIILLHPSQLQIYVDQQLNVESPHYNVGGIVKLIGELNVELFKETLCRLPEVFDIFRMRLENNDQGVHWVLTEEWRNKTKEIDFSYYENPAQYALAWAQNQFNIPYYLDSGNFLYQHTLLKISSEEYWYFRKYHHLLADGTGFSVENSFISAQYSALVNKTDFNPVYPQYAMEAVEDLEQYNSPSRKAKHECYWKKRIPGIPENVFQQKSIYNSRDNKESGRHIIDLTAEDKKYLKDLQNKTGSSLQHLTIAALSVILAHSEQRDEVIFGIPIHKRNSRKKRSVFGLFSAVLPFYAIFEKEKQLIDFIKGISSLCRNDYRFNDYFIGDLRKQLNIESTKSMVEILINHELIDFTLDLGSKIRSETITLSSQFESYPLHLRWRDCPNEDRFQLYSDFRYDYFDEEQVMALAKRLVNLLLKFDDLLEQKIANIQIITPEEFQLIHHAFNNTGRTYSFENNCIHLIENQRIKSPLSTSVVFMGKELNYAQLSEKTNKLAEYLATSKVGIGSMVPICINRSIEMIIGILAIMKAGAAYVPLDPEQPEIRLQNIVNETGSNIILTDTLTAPKLANISVKRFEIDGHWHEIPNQAESKIIYEPAPDNLAYVMYTSGSTGMPKGVMISHKSLTNHLLWVQEQFVLKASDKVLQKTNYCFDISIWELLWPLTVGAQIIIAEPEKHKDTAYLQDLIDRTAISHVVFVPSMLSVFLNSIDQGTCTSVSKILSIGEPLTGNLLTLCAEKLPDADLFNLYGPTEATVAVTCWNAKLLEGTEVDIAIGKPVANTALYVLNKYMQLVPIGSKGELCIAGIQLANGYLKQPELTASNFVENKFCEGDASIQLLYKTGDICSWQSNGDLKYYGRTDSQVKIHGYRVELMEIEKQISLLDNIQNVKVLLTEDKITKAKYFSAYIQLKNHVVLPLTNESSKSSTTGTARSTYDLPPKIGLNKETFLRDLTKKLPGYMIPAQIIFVNDFPVNANGKLDLKSLSELTDNDEMSFSITSSMSDTEKVLLQIWKELFRNDHISVQDSFFKLKGDSIIAIQIVTKARKQGIEIQAKDIFIHQTIRRILKNIEVTN